MKKPHDKKNDNSKKEKILWVSVASISVIIFLFWMYNFVSSARVKLSNQKEQKMMPQITDLKEQLEEIKNKFNEFSIKNATGSSANIENSQEKFRATSTNINNYDVEINK